MDESFPPGLYERLLTTSLSRTLAQLNAEFGDPDAEEAVYELGLYLQHLLSMILRYHVKPRRDTLQRYAEITNQLVRFLSEITADDSITDHMLDAPLRILQSIGAEYHSKAIRPDTPLSRAALFTGSMREPSLASQLKKEIRTADYVDLLCSFIRWSGVRMLLEDLQHLTTQSAGDRPRLRIATTSYMGATEVRAIEALAKLPNTEIYVNYDSKHTRLHAKAWIFHRDSGFGSAYIGSANLSRVAISDGLEWTTKLSQYEQPYLWKQIVSMFDVAIQEDFFELYRPDDADKLAGALAAEQVTPYQSPKTYFELRPYPFQESILDAIEQERRIGLKRHLVVAATGTGKTMIAAFDYRRIAQERGTRPRLLFVAHRQEILEQALATFQQVLRDYNFGDLYVGGHQPQDTNHLFCSIQTYNRRQLWTLPADAYEYIVIDEFHHAAAASYQRLLQHVDPEVLLGLTATPERHDGIDVLHWFDGRITAEIRLPDAIERRLLCPFQYFGITDNIDLRDVQWRRNGYDPRQLANLLTGNHARARLVIDKVREILLDPAAARGLGFCVSKAHATFMAEQFNAAGIRAAALTADSPPEERRTVQDRLQQREINFVFVVDLYNEGVDIPAIDTVLFLRPTESLTVFLQQLGRGLRLEEGKQVLTVLDFVGNHRKEFQFAPRFRALLRRSDIDIEKEIETEFPHLPSGCDIQLERKAAKIILENVRTATHLGQPAITRYLRAQSQQPTFEQAIADLGIPPEKLLGGRGWRSLLASAGWCVDPTTTDPDWAILKKVQVRLLSTDDRELILSWQAELDREIPPPDPIERCRYEMLHIALWSADAKPAKLEEAHRRLQQNPAFITDLKEIFAFLAKRARIGDPVRHGIDVGPLRLHCTYTRDQIRVALGVVSLTDHHRHREGVLHVPDRRLDAFFVTLQKSEREFTPTTLYDDYFISRSRFHWQSQSNTSAESRTGRRYIRHREHGYTPLLFVRPQKKDAGLTCPFTFLGPLRYVSHHGSRPISLVWELEVPLPAGLFQRFGLEEVA